MDDLFGLSNDLEILELENGTYECRMTSHSSLYVRMLGCGGWRMYDVVSPTIHNLQRFTTYHQSHQYIIYKDLPDTISVIYTQFTRIYQMPSAPSVHALQWFTVNHYRHLHTINNDLPKNSIAIHTTQFLPFQEDWVTCSNPFSVKHACGPAHLI